MSTEPRRGETIYVPVFDLDERVAGLRAGADGVEPNAPDLAAKLRRAADEWEAIRSTER